MFNIAKEEFQYGQHKVVLETGEIARQASGAVLVNVEDTIVLATVVAAKSAKPGQDFFPLTVDYIEKTYAAGKIPGGFFKREGRPSEKETLTSRLIDRPLRPLFPDGFYNEVQVVCTVISLNPEVDPDIPAMIGASAAMAISGVPFNGPIGAARVGYIDGQYVLNPTLSQLKNSKMDLVVSGTESAVLMVESEADQLSEDVMLGGVVFGHDQGNIAIAAINRLVEKAGKPEWDWTPAEKDQATIDRIKALAEGPLREAYGSRNKQERSQKLKTIHADIEAQVAQELSAAGKSLDSNLLAETMFGIEANVVRSQILNGEPRIDGLRRRSIAEDAAAKPSVSPASTASHASTSGCSTRSSSAPTVRLRRTRVRIETPVSSKGGVSANLAMCSGSIAMPVTATSTSPCSSAASSSA